MRYTGGVIWAAGAFVGFLIILAFALSEGTFQDTLEGSCNSIKNGMTLEAVENLIGPADAADAAERVEKAEEGRPVTLTWTRGKKSVSVTFVNGKVYAKTKGGF